MADNAETEAPEAIEAKGRSIRPVIEHALTVYYDGNAELARTLINRLLSENEAK
ncbi:MULTISPECIES: hypothetical protein [unclassified Streptomyces]|uniref:hypothetical protein n=1 Tax=unclassified Streptomyces TaxID=2593676 RepID=UPI00136B9261|nr:MULTISPECIES: hypothetical protein [unclassified Streptomyces]NDZ98460.1 hypothetical protein [Streptomyces sp. SID10116]MYY79813.1 hypothetical protein [Streptomyces sp. SID335]MYZ16029.1 hypothetical protein [Streptomyces sp. SID337]NDZ84450.1 hypothetical protein [Streptomyces sp. SID10115]NEB43413.1 hypothetical protein [Streptomyces sp. SID339]